MNALIFFIVERRAMRRLHISRTDKKLLGVCGGIAETYNLDPTVVRLAVEEDRLRRLRGQRQRRQAVHDQVNLDNYKGTTQSIWIGGSGSCLISIAQISVENTATTFTAPPPRLSQMSIDLNGRMICF